jgi:hypothetical protein
LVGSHLLVADAVGSIERWISPYAKVRFIEEKVQAQNVAAELRPRSTATVA